jgi:hypothetical protein
VLSTQVIFVLVFVLVWSALRIWTVYKLNYLSGGDASLSIRYGVNTFGIGMWLVSIATGVVLSWQINPQTPAFVLRRILRVYHVADLFMGRVRLGKGYELDLPAATD